ncbi:hypothetical protein AB0E63_08850 [Kribbella sp. NPDC026596]|uniref:hypothetical protein n=1 Tax=Kribbella sp. NPDC026596 TaxID=3155122 RepID=UPI0033EE8ABB
MSRRVYGAPLNEEQIGEYVRRCPAENRWAFEGWLRGERQLDGDRIESEPTKCKPLRTD